MNKKKKKKTKTTMTDLLAAAPGLEWIPDAQVTAQGYSTHVHYT